jgi:hypothetical protein
VPRQAPVQKASRCRLAGSIEQSLTDRCEVVAERLARRSNLDRRSAQQAEIARNDNQGVVVRSDRVCVGWAGYGFLIRSVNISLIGA